MNKILLSFGAAMFALSSFAQTNSVTSGNTPAEDLDGYIYNFNGTAVDNCISATKNEGSIKSSWDAKSTSVNSVTDGKLVLKVDTSTAAGWATGDAFTFIHYEENCSGVALDLSKISSIKMDVNSTSKVEYFYIAFCDGTDKCADFALFVDTLEIGDNTIDYAGVTSWKTWDNKVVDSTAITYMSVGFRAGAYGTAPVPGTYTIGKIAIANSPEVGLSNKAKESSISVYPNPASTSVNFEKELQNVTIYNIVGTQVYQAAAATTVDVSSFQAGVYYLQHAEGTSRFTVQ